MVDECVVVRPSNREYEAKQRVWQRLPGRYLPVLEWSRLSCWFQCTPGEESEYKVAIAMSETFILLMLDRLLLREAKPQGSRAFTVSRSNGCG